MWKGKQNMTDKKIDENTGCESDDAICSLLKIEQNEHYWECGDHCCSETYTDTIINGEMVDEGRPFFYICEDTAQIICDYLKIDIEFL